MLCPKCGKDNPDNVGTCTACNYELPAVSAEGKRVDVRISKPAIASLVLIILSILAFALAVALRDGVIACAGLILAVSALIVGIVGLVQIELSAGRLAGRGFAVVGITIPAVFFLLIYGTAVFYRPRMGTFRMTCGANLSAIGKAMLIYAKDYEDELPRAGGRASIWQPKINNWQAGDRITAYNLQPDGTGGAASISASFYLLIKYSEISAKPFVCTHDKGTTEFKAAEYGVRDKELIDLWDFGPEPWKHCSYAYHMPYGLYALTTSSEPGMAVAADRNPWIATAKLKARNFSLFKPDGDIKQQKAGNSLVHQEDGQNVLFVDGHVYFEKRAYCAINDDNIYTFWDGGDIRRGGAPVVSGSDPKDRKDSFLVHDPPVAGRK